MSASLMCSLLPGSWHTAKQMGPFCYRNGGTQGTKVPKANLETIEEEKVWQKWVSSGLG
jgi:hypothetical protein